MMTDVPTKTVLSDGTIEYRNQNGVLHRNDGPAMEKINGSTAWMLNGNFHRADGPAIEGQNGHKEWWLNGVEVTMNDVMKNQQS